jgi:serine/threonine protein kinase
MLAGFLPFHGQSDPPIAMADQEEHVPLLLLKTIYEACLDFPEYVTPHSRDLLRRILVQDPRKRADIYEIARHSWLAEYSHVVDFITKPALRKPKPKNPLRRIPATSNISYQANVNRPKIKKWVGARTVTYGGDDWGEDEKFG